MKLVNMYEAKTHFAELIRQALLGQEIVIAKTGKPLVRLVPVGDTSKEERIPGSAKEQLRISEDFDAPLPPEILQGFSS